MADIPEDYNGPIPMLPRPAVTFADHSYPAFSEKQVLAYAEACVAVDRLTRQDPETIRQAALEEADGWQPIETAPMSLTPVLGLINGSATVIAKSKDNRWCEIRHMADNDGVGARFVLSQNAQPSHWMRFPVRGAIRALKEAGHG